MSTLDDCLDVIQQGSLAFAVGSFGLFYLSDNVFVRNFTSSPSLLLSVLSHLYPAPHSHPSQQASVTAEEEEDERQVHKNVRGVIVRSGALIDSVTFLFQVDQPGSEENEQEAERERTTHREEAVTFGGNGGTANSVFELETGEWIAQVRGRRGAYIDQIQFVTNLGRLSPAYGGTGGEPFSFELPNGEAIGGLDVVVSINGWIRAIRGVIPVHKVRVLQPERPAFMRDGGIIQPHRTRVRQRLRFLHAMVIMYTAFLIFAMRGFALEMLRGPVPLQLAASMERKSAPPAFVSVPVNAQSIADSVKFADGEELVRWVILNIQQQSNEVINSQVEKKPQEQQHDKDGGATLLIHGKTNQVLGVLVKEVVDRATSESSPHRAVKRPTSGARTGILRKFDKHVHGLVFEDVIEASNFRWLWSNEASGGPTPEESRKLSRSASFPVYFVDQSFSPAVFYISSLAVLFVFLYTTKTEWKQSSGKEDPVIYRFRSEEAMQGLSPSEIAALVDQEVLEEGTLVLPWSSSVVAVTRNWLIKTNYLGLDAIAINDARLVDLRVSGRWIMGELVQIVTLRIESIRSVSQMGHHRGRATYFFDVTLPRMQFELLQASFIDRVNKRQEEIVRQREEAFMQRYREMLMNRVRHGTFFSASKTSQEECLGACGCPPTVVIRKRCVTCEERHDCPCEPSWCHNCLLRWWLTRNRTRIELIGSDSEIEPTWQARCPTCRVYFCLQDVIPRQDIGGFLFQDQFEKQSQGFEQQREDQVRESDQERDQADGEVNDEDEDESNQDQEEKETSEMLHDVVEAAVEMRRARAAAAAERRRQRGL